MNHGFLNIITIASVLCGILVITSKNPIVSVLFLIGLFMTIAGYLMMLGINFIGLSYLLVYVGAVSILFLFILMLINVRISELVTDNSNSIPLAIIIGIFVGVNQLFPRLVAMPILMVQDSDVIRRSQTNFSRDGEQYLELTSGSAKTDFAAYGSDPLLVTSQSWDLRLSETFHITSIGNILYTNYPLWLILTSLILLLAMIGSILITIKQ